MTSGRLMLSGALGLIGCSEHFASNKPEPEPPPYPEEPDWVCPEAWPLDREEVRRTFAWDTDVDFPHHVDETYAGQGEYHGTPTLTVEQRDTAGAVLNRDHYVCDGGNVWLVALEAPAGEDICPCAERDCVFETYVYDPPLLSWWDEAVADELAWSSDTTGLLYHATVLSCEREEFFVGEVPDLVLTVTPSQAATLSTLIGTIDAVRLAHDWTKCHNCWDNWYSIEALGLVRADLHSGDSEMTYALSSLTVPD